MLIYLQNYFPLIKCSECCSQNKWSKLTRIGAGVNQNHTEESRVYSMYCRTMEYYTRTLLWGIEQNHRIQYQNLSMYHRDTRLELNYGKEHQNLTMNSVDQWNRTCEPYHVRTVEILNTYQNLTMEQKTRTFPCTVEILYQN